MLSPTIDNINHVLKLAINDPAGRKALRTDWQGFVASHFSLNTKQSGNLTNVSGLPADKVAQIQSAVADVCKNGGAIRLTSVKGKPGVALLVIRPTTKLRSARFSCTVTIGSFSCHAQVD